MNRIFPLLAGLLLAATLNAPSFAQTPQAAKTPAPTVAPTVAVTPTPVPPAAVAAKVAELEEVNLLLIFPVQEPLRKPDSEAPDEAAIAAATEAGQVWVNAKSKIYHRAGTTYYGKTKAGFFLPEAQAIKQGYRGVKE